MAVMGLLCFFSGNGLLLSKQSASGGRCPTQRPASMNLVPVRHVNRFAGTGKQVPRLLKIEGTGMGNLDSGWIDTNIGAGL